MATVTIRGSIMPSAHLARGQVVTVQRTPQIENLIRQGFVDVIEEHLDTPEPVAATVPAPVPPVKVVPEPTPEPPTEPTPESPCVEPETRPSSSDPFAR
jgi:hypothetical protein